MRDVSRSCAAVRSASSTRGDLLLESLALRHQVSVLARSNRRFCPSDRLLWRLLRWLWPRWREALVLVQPATVDRWHRAGLRRCWRGFSRRPGRPRIDSMCRDLIRRLAAENHLWGAPRIHGELRKLGIAVSERTVSTISAGSSDGTVTDLAYVFHEPPRGLGIHAARDVVICAGAMTTSWTPLACRAAQFGRFVEGLSTANQSAVVDWPGSHRHTFLRWRLVQDHVCDRASALNQTCRAPPLHPTTV